MFLRLPMTPTDRVWWWFQPISVQIHLALSEQSLSECVQMLPESDFQDSKSHLNRSEFIESRYHENLAWSLSMSTAGLQGF